MPARLDLPAMPSIDIPDIEPVHWYRIDRHSTYHDKIRVSEFEVIKTTPCGVWLAPISKKAWLLPAWPFERKFVLHDARKRFAYPTVELAVASFKARKKHHQARLEQQLSLIEGQLADLAKEFGPKQPPPQFEDVFA